MTQSSFAREGTITPEMRVVAEKENLDPEIIREGVARGRIVIPKNVGRTFSVEGIGAGLKTNEDLEKVIVIVGRSLNGVEFEALDHAPCSIFFLVLAPEQVAGMHLRILAQISRLLKDESFRKQFLAAEDLDSLWTMLKNV